MTLSYRYATAQEAEEAFYAAFEQNDLDTMMGVWSHANYAECIHPMSKRIQGFEAIRKGWDEIFRNTPRIRFRLHGQRQILRANLAIHIVNEHILVNDGNRETEMLATNIYEETETGWRMILHHATPLARPRQGAQGEEESPPRRLH